MGPPTKSPQKPSKELPDMTTLQLTDHEIQALAGLLDAGVKALGLRAVKDAATLLAKLEEATQPKETTND